MTIHDKFEVSDQLIPYRTQWQTVDDLVGGVVQMKRAGTRYLPKFKEETNEDYQSRLNGATLDPGYSSNINKGVGRIFSKPMKLNEKVDAALLEFFDDVDTTGRSATQFSKIAFKSALNHGVSFILVDYPVITPNSTLDDERAGGATPFWISIKATQLLEIRSGRIQGKQTLTYFRYIESVSIDSDADLVTSTNSVIRNATRSPTTTLGIRIEQVKIFQIDGETGQVTYEIWRLTEGTTGSEFLFDQGVMNGLTRIPIVPIYTNRDEFMLGTPPLMDLAALNLRHWRSQSDQNNILTVVRLPMLVLVGLNPLSDAQGNTQPIEIVHGPNTVLNLPDGGSVKYVEHTGKAIDSGFKDLEILERKMHEFGFETKASQAIGTETATGRIIDAAESNSMLQDMRLSLKDSIFVALQFTADWLGITFDELENLSVNESFGTNDKDPAQIKLMLDLFDKGIISAESLLEEFKKRGILDESVTAPPSQHNLDTGNDTNE